ncbi:hypothetical protein G5I_00895 [Acromyrmex echinatior]|uniref:Uncharacterized protein n=1 Tax=Acromyrmex echinatior TaxID=103372 RepID=F4W6R2_ACREC|nr:hypothetical protein G5I_00895 [Acromyrmex echinatior]
MARRGGWEGVRTTRWDREVAREVDTLTLHSRVHFMCTTYETLTPLRINYAAFCYKKIESELTKASACEKTWNEAGAPFCSALHLDRSRSRPDFSDAALRPSTARNASASKAKLRGNHELSNAKQQLSPSGTRHFYI